MNLKQFLDRIGNIDERLIQQAEPIPCYRQQQNHITLRRCIAAAATIVLMGCSFCIGAFAFAHETVIEVPVEMPVEVPVEPESITIEEIGLTLIFPDHWKDQYALEKNEFGEYLIYNPVIRNACEAADGFTWGGMLFYIRCWEEQLTPEQAKDIDGEWNFARNSYIMTTRNGTYLLYYASDIQFTPELESVYRQMESEIRDIRFVADRVFG